MGRSTVHYADNETNNILKRLHNKLRPAGTPVERVEYIIELLLLRIFEAKIKQDSVFKPLRKLFEGEDYRLLYSHLLSLTGDQILSQLNKNIFPFYASILSKASRVIEGNISTKIQDQLVLMEEVFANSNFTNNVKGGVVAEVIGLVNEIEESRILKTDLLGDAIESALSETGGTKDLGLYRTPDHIRKMMVEMVDPDFSDTIFDPACGTAGFLFDAYEHVISKSKKTRKFPSKHIAYQFYRVGIGGVEYQGRIRKMAAVNMYIRGLNPHNIAQGDSLKMYDSPCDAGSKSVVIANPPFGAERDQPAYPNVWEEYSKESETTILFVKLMFDLLKQKGRCAVVVSEGFLTWGQNSACALRKMLLNDANLRAIISIPQGVFVSKSGQGAKTSILYFEKGQSTDFVWYYKIENDGFSMGTNRNSIEGSQIPELMRLFNEIKQGKKPQDTKYSFCVTKDQIETLDPRIANKIKNEVSEKIKEKNAKKREKHISGLDQKIKSNKIDKRGYAEKVWQFDNISEGQIDNEVAKAIEKAHDYHFNLQKYRSDLSDVQLKDWKKTIKGVQVNNELKTEKKYQELYKAMPSSALQIIASFDPKDAMQVDIVREYLNKLDKKYIIHEKKLVELFENLRTARQYSSEALSKLIVQKANKITLKSNILYKQVKIKLYGKGVLLRQEILGVDVKTESQYLVNAGDFIMSKIDARNGAFGIVPQFLNGAIVTSSFPYFKIQDNKINPKYLEIIVTKKRFYDQINSMVSGATGRRSVDVDSFLDIQIPLPIREVQNEIVEKIEKLEQIIEGAGQIRGGFTVDPYLSGNYTEEFIGKLAQVDGSPVRNLSPLANEIYVGGENIESGTGRLFNLLTVKQADIIGPSYRFNKGHVVYSKVRPNLQKCFYADFDGVCSSDIYPLKVNEELILPRYLALILQSKRFASKTESLQAGRSGMPKINQDQLAQIKISLPPIEIQRQIVGKLDKQMQAIEEVDLLKSEAQKRIEDILAEVWGEW
ncbi:N-6 DNA methylase [Candidatus Margulisiibacteriota bacterium]